MKLLEKRIVTNAQSELRDSCQVGELLPTDLQGCKMELCSANPLPPGPTPILSARHVAARADTQNLHV